MGSMMRLAAARSITDGTDVREIGFLCVAQIRDQRPGGLNCRRSPFETKAFEAVRLELVEQRAAAASGSKLQPSAIVTAGSKRERHELLDNRRLPLVVDDQLPRTKHGNFIGQGVEPSRAVILRRAKFTGREIDEGGAEYDLPRSDAAIAIRKAGSRVEVTGIGQRSW